MGIIRDFIEWFLNYVVGYIPIWHVRKAIYKLCGMKIGSDSYILMGTKIMCPWRIKIGSGTYINENCFIDGRGELIIGNNVSISRGTNILTGTHDSHSERFEFVSMAVKIEDNVWTGINSIIMPGVILKKGCILAAGSVAIRQKIDTVECSIYSGVPAVKIGKRNLSELYSLGSWKPRLR